MKLAALAAGALALVTFPLWSKAWESSRYATTVLENILIFSIFAMSLNLLVGYAGMPSLGHAAYYGAGAYAAGIVGQRLASTNLLLGLVAAVVVAALLAAVVGFLSVRASGIFFLMITLAFAQIVFAYAFKATEVTGGANGLSAVGRPDLFGLSFNSPDNLYMLTAVAFLAIGALIWRIVSSAYGRSLIGVRENERRMRALGYNVRLLKLSVFVLAGALAGVAGAFHAWDQRFVSAADTAVPQSISGIIMVLVGGAGTLAGPILGAALVFLIERVLDSFIPFAQTVLGVVFVLFVLLARGGVVGVARALVAWAR